ncbi:SDR family NAD(P)-dependent oxidoreductase [Gloeobacter kilaueensis]|uniref:Amino acid adenylation domain-containing protein n=1 Tax=Gloeobacter kilaueensis (strain ATCC BAA-2537 / CCAP 1431/1 / ULC 316 / JS1) TaxID=1183438 RepID=U5QGL0_GLOK1|nr:SDR family NAD(P)-dependent oxidoreductase [Gloeobacter kilaueensis]AGY58066.1 amino acid adenylation domain-containing protein [Gloeobacter kilaueensis JS1]
MQAETTGLDDALLAEIRQLLAEETGRPPEAISDAQVREYAELLLQASEQTIPAHQRFADQVETDPEAVALVVGNEQWTYRQLADAVDQLVPLLSAGGIVALSQSASPWTVAALIAVLKAGGAVLPFDPADPSFRNHLSLAGAKLVLSTETLSELPCPQLVLGQSDVSEKTSDPPASVTGTDPALIVNTGRGSVRFDHALVENRLQWLQQTFPLDPSDRVLLSAGPATSLLEWLWPLTTGACLVLAPAASGEMMRFLETRPVSVLFATPSQLADVLRTQCSSLRQVLCGGELLAQPLVDRFLAAHPAVELVYFWKAPEVAVAATFQICRPGTGREWVPAGQPAVTSVYVLDSYRQPVPIGVTGEIYLAGAAVGLEHSQPERTDERFIESPFADGPLLRTGEVGRLLADGSLDRTSSLERTFWIRGVYVSAATLETALRLDPTIEDCAVLPRLTEDDRWELVAYTVSGSPLAPERLLAQLRGLLPAALVPDRLVPLASLPLTPAGAVDESALQQLPILDTDLAERWEAHLETLPEIQQVTVLLQPHPEPSPPLHLSELLVEFESSPRFSSKPSVEPSSLPENSPPQPSPEITDVNNFPTAFVDGGALPEPGADFPSTLVELLPWAAAHFPDHGFTFLLADKSEQRLSYPQLLHRARCILTALRSRSIAPHTPVLLLLDQPEQLVPAFWGCVLGGFVPLIVSVPPSFEQANAQLEKLLHLSAFLSQPPVLCNHASEVALSHALPGNPVLVVEQLGEHSPAESFFQPEPEAIALLNLTSGSTGTPKCIPLTHRNLLARARGANLLCNHSAEDILLNWLPFEHIGSISDWHIRAMTTGCRVVYLQKETVLSSPLYWLELVDHYRITHSWAPNFAYGLVNQALRQQPSRSWNLRSLKMLLSAGETVAASTVEEFYSHLHCCGLAGTVLHPAFGMAEVASGITYFQPTQDTPLTVHRLDKVALDNGQALSVSDKHTSTIELIDLGRPIAGMQLRVVDEHNHLLTQRQVGRLQLRGEAVFSGYLQNPQATAAVLLADGWFDTGDLAFLDNGHLVLVGRHKETIILNGANYYSHDIEQLVESVEGVEASFTAACAVRAEGNATEKLAIFLVAKAGIEPAELLASVRQQVVQKLGVEVEHLLLVEKGDIPKTSIGKIQRRQLQKRLEAGEFLPLQKRMDVLQNNQRTVGDWFYSKQWRQRVLEVSDKEPKGAVLVFVDDSGLGQSLRPELKECVQVEAGEGFQKLGKGHYRLNPTSVEQYGQLLGSVESEGLHLRHILHLWTYQERQVLESAQAVEAAQQKGLYSVLALVQALAARHDGRTALTLRVVSSGAQAVLPGEEPAWEQGGLTGLLKTVGQELPWLDCRHIDLPLEEGERCRDGLLAELVSGRGEREVAYRQGRRWVARLQKVDMVARVKQPVPLRKGGFYLLTGGLGGIGLEVAKHLLTRYQARLLLVGRAEAKADRLRTLENLGGAVLYRQADVCDLQAMEAAVEGAGSHWQGAALDGIFHLAGAYNEQLLVEQSVVSLQEVLRPKLTGSWVLHQLLRKRPEALFVGFASVVGYFGAATLGAYAAANSAQEAFAAYQRANGYGQSYCTSWSIWDDIGMSQNNPHRQTLQARGFQAIPAHQGVHSLLAALSSGESHLLIGLDDSRAAIRLHLENPDRQLLKLNACLTRPFGGQDTRDSSLTATIRTLRLPDRFRQPSRCEATQLAALPRTADGRIDREKLRTLGRAGRVAVPERIAPRNDLERQLARLWQEVLNVPEPGIADSFFALGGSSLMLTQLVSRIRDHFRVDLPLQILFGTPTLAGMAKLILARQLERQDQNKVARMLQEVKNLSPEQIKALLQARKP